jgi:HEAT repeat protein
MALFRKKKYDERLAKPPNALKLAERGDIKGLMDLLASPDQSLRAINQRGWAAQELGNLGVHSAVDPLIETLEDPVKRVQYKAALALGQIGDKRVRGALILKLNGDVGVAIAAAYALLTLGDQRGLATLVTIMDGPDSYDLGEQRNRQLACRFLLGLLPDPTARPDPHHSVGTSIQLRAVDVLEDIHRRHFNPRSHNSISSRLDLGPVGNSHPDMSVRAAAQSALWRLGFNTRPPRAR